MGELPNTFRKLVTKKFSTHFRDAVEIEVVPMPTFMKPTEVLVKNCFLGINASDINFTAGKYKPDVRPPFDCGFEALGEIVKVGEKVKDFTVGNKVVTQSFGAFAEYQTVPSRLTKKVPSIEKSWLPLSLSGTTASISLKEIVKPLKGEVAIVTAAAGGTGQFAVQLLKRKYGCRVIGVTSSSQKEEFLKQLGCDDVINQERESVKSGIQRISPTGVNLAYESVGGEAFEDIVNSIALYGRILSIGSISGYKDQSTWTGTKSSHIPIQTRLLSKSASLHTFFLPHYTKYIQEHFSILCDLCTSEVIQSFVDPAHFKGLEALPDAVDYLYQRKNLGKVIVEILKSTIRQMQSFSKVLSTLAKSGLEDIILSSKGIGDEELDALIGAMKVAPIPVRAIDLSRNSITSVGAAALAQFLLSHPYVREIQLEDNKIEDEGARSFIEVFRGKSYPRIFNIKGNPCSKSIVHNLALLCQGDVFSSDVRRGLITWEADELDLTGINYNKVDPRLIPFFVEHVEGLKSLKLSGCSIGDGGAGVIGTLVKESFVTHIDMSNNGISDVGVSVFIEHSNLYQHPTITWLSFAQNIRIGNVTPQKLPSELFEKNEKITYIGFDETSCTSSARSLVEKECELNKQPTVLKRFVVRLRTNDPSCTSINLQWEDGMSEAAKYIAPVLKLNTYLLDLNLGNSSLGNEGAKTLASTLRSQQTIRVLGLANNEISASGAKALFQCFQQHPSLEEVNLASNNITDDAASVILTTVRLNNLLKVVNLVNNFLSPEYMNEIAGFILINQSPKEIRRLLAEIEANDATLTTLHLYDPTGETFYNDASVRLLCQALLLNKTVTSLDLSKNVVGDVGVGFIADMLMSNCTITELTLAENSISSCGAKRLCDALRTNTAIKRLDISGNAINNSGMEEFPEMLKYNNVLLEVLMDNTSISPEMKTQITEAADLNKEPPELKAVVYKLIEGDTNLTKVDIRRARCSRALDDQSITTLSIHLAGKSWVDYAIFRGNSIGNLGCKGLRNVLTHEGCGLVYLDLSENPIEDTGLDELSQALMTNRTLAELDLSMTKVTSDGILRLTEVLKTNPTVEQVICPEQVSADAFCAINRELMVNVQPKSLKELLARIESNENIPIIALHDPVTPFGDPACQLLSAALVKNTYVTELDLSGNQFTCESIPFLSEALSQCPLITSVNLSKNSIDDRGGRLLISCLRENDNIISLDLQNNQITEDCQSIIDELLFLNAGSVKLKKVLLNHRSGKLYEELIDLNASRNKYRLNDEDVRILCTVLMDSTVVRAVDLGMNNITDVGCAMLAEVLRYNHTMEALYLDYNQIGGEGGEALYNSLKVNPQLHTLYLEGTEVPQEIWDDILSLLHVNETPLKDRIDMKNLPFEDVDDDTQFRNTDYAIAQEEKVGKDAMHNFGMPRRPLLLKS